MTRFLTSTIAAAALFGLSSTASYAQPAKDVFAPGKASVTMISATLSTDTPQLNSCLTSSDLSNFFSANPVPNQDSAPVPSGG